MALPKQVEKQLQEIEAIERSIAAPQEAAPAETTAEPSAPAPSTDEGQPTETVVQQQPEPAPEPTEDWKLKYERLHGKFNAEVPRLHQQNKELVNQLNAMQAQIEELRQARTAPEPAEERLVTQQDEEAFGADMIDLQRRVTREVMREFVTPLQQELKLRDAKIAQLEQTLTQTGGEVATMSFEQKLNLAVPNFDQINTDPKWIAWLDETDPFTGEPRRAYAEYVYNNGFVDKVKQVVDLYQSMTAEPAPTQRNQRQTELQRQVQPARTATTPAQSTEARVYTEAEIGRLFDKVSVLNRQGKFEEASTLEAELDSAYLQGRVRA